MRKIIVNFNSSRKIQRLKKIMKDVYKNTLGDNLKLAKFNLNKPLIPAKVENVEIEIRKITGSNVTVVIPKTSLTFLSIHPPFDSVESTCDIEGNYIVLPWNVATNSGRNELKSLINKISASTTALKYTITLNTDEGASALDTISQAELSLSENSFEDNTEELFSRIRELEDSLRMTDQNLRTANSEVSRQQNLIQQRNLENTSLTTRVRDLENQINQQQTQITGLNNQLASSTSNATYYSQSYNDYYSKYTQEYNRRQSLEKIIQDKKLGGATQFIYGADVASFNAWHWTGRGTVKLGPNGHLTLTVLSTEPNF